jgi:hypothetical protein
MRDPSAFQERFGAAVHGDALAPTLFEPGIERAVLVHRNTARAAAVEALEANYPVVRALLGGESFTGTALAFATSHPPRDPRLCLYGAAFSSFLRTFPALAAYPYLVDVARLERLCTEALFAEDAPPFDPASISAATVPDRLSLHPAARIACFPNPAASLWRAHQTDDATEALGGLAWRPETALVTRIEDKINVAAVDEATRVFLDACANGRALIEAADAARAAGADLTSLISNLTALWALRSAAP